MDLDPQTEYILDDLWLYMERVEQVYSHFWVYCLYCICLFFICQIFLSLLLYLVLENKSTENLHSLQIGLTVHIHDHLCTLYVQYKTTSKTAINCSCKSFSKDHAQHAHYCAQCFIRSRNCPGYVVFKQDSSEKHLHPRL